MVHSRPQLKAAPLTVLDIGRVSPLPGGFPICPLDRVLVVVPITSTHAPEKFGTGRAARATGMTTSKLEMVVTIVLMPLATVASIELTGHWSSVSPSDRI